MSDDDLPFEPPEAEQQARMVEAVLFASATALSAREIEERLPRGSDIGEALRAVEARYAGRGVTLVRVAGKWAFRTAPDLAFLLRREAVETKKLSRAAMETLAIIAYHQPATRAEIEEMRGVAVSRGTLDTLLDLDWVKLGPRRQTPGARPVTLRDDGRVSGAFRAGGDGAPTCPVWTNCAGPAYCHRRASRCPACLVRMTTTMAMHRAMG